MVSLNPICGALFLLLQRAREAIELEVSKEEGAAYESCAGTLASFQRRGLDVSPRCKAHKGEAKGGKLRTNHKE